MRLIDADVLDEEVANFFLAITGNPKQATVVRECKKSFQRMIEEQSTCGTAKPRQWIPVTKRLPENGTRALVTFEDGFVAATDYYGNGWDLWADSGDVIAWMPLPEPYREEGTP